MYKSESSLIEFGESNIFEEFYELIEKHKLNTSRKFSIEDMYISLSAFDLAYQKFSSTNNQRSNSIVYAYLNHCLYCFLIPFKFNGFSNRPFYWAFNRFIQFSTLLLKNSHHVNNPNFYFRNISQNFPSLWQGSYIDILRRNEFNFNIHTVDQFEEYHPIFNRAEISISIDFGTLTKFKRDTPKTKYKIYTPNYEVIEVDYDSEIQEFKAGSISFEMEIDFQISDDNNDAQKLLQALYLLITALSNINNVKIEIEELKIGSLLGKIRIYMSDLVAKEETKTVIETTKETLVKAVSGGTVSHVGTKKTNQEAKKIQKETEILDKDLRDRLTDYEAKLSNALKLEKQALENEQLQIKNAKEKLEILDKLSDLASKGMLETDMLKIDINGILYFLKDHNQIQSPNVNLDEIT
ncbi:MAG: hypothetical protein JST78_03215 [Bacteroidetes bacterium]|nr:hypothetical protein [Bacteroidota bacterium]